MLAARIDLLEQPEKEALQAASAIGRVFWSGPVYQLVQGEPDLRVLEERDFVRRRPGSSMAGEREYAIKHALTREVAYESLPKARRARLHAAFARWLEHALGDEAAPLLAHHYGEAVRPEDADLAWSGYEDEAADLRHRAVAWLTRAAELATSRYELEDAIGLLRRALELEQDLARSSNLWHALGRAYALNFEGEPFWDAIAKAIALTDDNGSRRICMQTSASGRRPGPECGLACPSESSSTAGSTVRSSSPSRRALRAPRRSPRGRRGTAVGELVETALRRSRRLPSPSASATPISAPPREAPMALKPRTVLEPFGLPALGQVRGDDELIRQALARFEAMGLDWHAAETRKLVAQP